MIEGEHQALAAFITAMLAQQNTAPSRLSLSVMLEGTHTSSNPFSFGLALTANSKHVRTKHVLWTLRKCCLSLANIERTPFRQYMYTPHQIFFPTALSAAIMAIHYFEDQSWLDLLLLTLPVVVPLLISFYFVMTEQPRPRAHANPLPTYNDRRGPREQLGRPFGQDRLMAHREALHTPPLNRSEMANPSLPRRQVPRPTSPLPFEHGVYMPDPRRSSRAERRRINEDDLIHR